MDEIRNFGHNSFITWTEEDLERERTMDKIEQDRSDQNRKLGYDFQCCTCGEVYEGTISSVTYELRKPDQCCRCGGTEYAPLNEDAQYALYGETGDVKF